MGDAFECDRCGDFQSGEPETRVPITEREEQGFNHTTITEEVRIDHTNWDLCDECAERLSNFLEGKLGFPDI